MINLLLSFFFLIHTLTLFLSYVFRVPFFVFRVVPLAGENSNSPGRSHGGISFYHYLCGAPARGGNGDGSLPTGMTAAISIMPFQGMMKKIETPGPDVSNC